MSRRRSMAAGVLGAAGIAARAVAASPAAPELAPELALDLVCQGLVQPTFVTHAPGDASRLFVTGKKGVVTIVNLPGGEVVPTPFLDITPLVVADYERGLLGLAFAPDYAMSGAFYVSYTSNPDADTVIARYRVSADSNVADPASEEIVLRFPRPIGHYGGWIGFGPDGHLYFGSGDGGTFIDPDPLNRAQDITDQFMGKILRLDVSGADAYPDDPLRNYDIPPDNPFVGREGDDEIWAYGLRQPWRCSFDRATGDLWIADVGQDTWEEIEVEPAAAAGFAGGRNYGWKCMEGTSCTGFGGCECGDAALVPPTWQYGHEEGCAVIGGYVYRGCAVPSLAGRYVFADNCSGRIWSMAWDGEVADVVDHTAQLNPPEAPVAVSITSLGEDAAGELYFCTFGGKVLRLTAPGCAIRGGAAGLGPCADLDGDGLVNGADLGLLLGAWGGACADLTGDGTTDGADLGSLLGSWTS